MNDIAPPPAVFDDVPATRMDDLTRDFAMSGTQAGLGSHLPFGKKPVLLVVDLVQAYLQVESPFFAEHLHQTQTACELLLRSARAHQVPVIYARLEYSAGGIDGGVFYRKLPALKAFLKGSPLAESPDSCQPCATDLVVSRQYPSAFFGTSLATTLGAMNCDTLIVTGFTTSGAIRATATDAMQHGLIPFVVSDACGDRDQMAHEDSLRDMQQLCAEITTVQEMTALFEKRP